MAVGFVVVLAVMIRVARHAYRIEDLTALGKEGGLDFGLRRVGNRPVKRQEQPSGESAPGPVAMEPMGVQFMAEFRCSYCDWAPMVGNKRPLSGKKFHENRCKSNPVNSRA